MVELAVLMIFPAAMALAASSDLFTMTIPNWIPLALVAGFAVFAAASGMDAATIATHGGAGLAMLVLGFAMFSFGWIGGGDAKVFAATALWLGWGQLFEYAVFAGLLGGALALALLAFRSLPLPANVLGQPWIARLHTAGNGVPYGIALCTAGLIVFSRGPWMTALAG